jgi:hypothetical protein
MRKTLSFLLLTALFAIPASAAKITIVNVDQPNIGFNDPTAATPVGGNEGTTVGQQRLNVYKRAADIWGAQLSSDVDIIVEASFFVPTAAECDTTSAVLAKAGPTRIVANFKNAPFQNVWYPIALASKFAGEDLEPTVGDIRMQFNNSLGTTTCFTNGNWYYGLDNNAGTRVNMLVTTLHEMTHGLGMTGAILTATGELRSGMPHIFEQHAFDLATGLRLDQMTNAQRIDARQSTGNLVWDGESIRVAANAHLGLLGLLKVTAPSSVARNYEVQPASFGPAIGNGAFVGKIVPMADGTSATSPVTNDGCDALTNAADLRGNVALVERGQCNFTVKAKFAQEAGAVAVVIYNNPVNTTACNELPPMGGADDTVTIPSVGISRRDGLALLAAVNAGTVNGGLQTDPSQRAGMASNGRIRLYAPCEFAPGSSVHHFDESASPNLLMEPYLDADVPVGTDLTLNFLLDIGWGQGGPRTGRTSLRR